MKKKQKTTFLLLTCLCLLGFNLKESELKLTASKNSLDLKEIHSTVKSYQDFPKKGIVFQDILPIFEKPKVLEKIVSHLEKRYKGHVDSVVGLDARGFIFGAVLAARLKVPFVPVRKKGKLPGPCYEASYTKEYGEDRFEMSKLVFKGKERVLVVDDLIATGGSARAALSLIKKAGARAVEFFAFSKVKGLKGTESLDVKSYILLEGK